MSWSAEHEGLSDIEPVRGVCQAHHDLLRENFPEIVRTICAPYVILKADTKDLGKEEADSAVDSLAEWRGRRRSLPSTNPLSPPW